MGVAPFRWGPFRWGPFRHDLCPPTTYAGYGPVNLQVLLIVFFILERLLLLLSYWCCCCCCCAIAIWSWFNTDKLTIMIIAKRNVWNLIVKEGKKIWDEEFPFSFIVKSMYVYVINMVVNYHNIELSCTMSRLTI